MIIEDKENQFANNQITLPEEQNFFVVVGANNSGKSTLLRSIIKTTRKENSYLVTVNRTVLTGEGSIREDYKKNFTSYTNEVLSQADDNTRPKMQPLQDFFNLKDIERKPILDWYNKYFPNRIIEEREDPENSASSMLLKVGAHSITKQGSGMRATLEIFIKLLDPSIKILCIDDPEVGLEPYLQKYLFQAIKDKASSDKKIIIATHSHHFLDIENEESNYVCFRNSEDKIDIKRPDDLKSVIFRLLGNTLSSFLLPEKTLIFEGQSDVTFLNQCLKHLDKKQYGIHNAGGNGNVNYAINSITNFLKFNEKNIPVYKDNTFVIVDDPIKDTLVREWKKLLGSEERLLVLNKDAIEYYYPEHILQEIFSTTESKDTIVKQYLHNDPNGYHGVLLTKTKLAKQVSDKLVFNDLDDLTNELFVFLKKLP